MQYSSLYVSNLAEKASGVMDRVRGQGIKKVLAVAFGSYPAVKDDDDAGVVFAADKASDTLTEFKHRFGEAVTHE